MDVFVSRFLSWWIFLSAGADIYRQYDGIFFQAVPRPFGSIVRFCAFGKALPFLSEL